MRRGLEGEEELGEVKEGKARAVAGGGGLVGMAWERLQGQARSQSLLGSLSRARFILSVVSSHQMGVII